MSSKYDYTGKTVHMGIDIHKKSYSVACISDGEIVKKDKLLAKPYILMNYLKRYFKNAKIKTAYEAGFSGFHLHRILNDNEIENIVIHPASVEISARDRVKTDKRDALKIATQLSTNRLKSIFVPDKKREAMRMVTRLRATLKADRRRFSNRIKSLLFLYGLIDPEDKRVMSKKYITEILEFIEAEGSYEEGFCFTLKQYANQWLQLTERIKEVEKRFSDQLKDDDEKKLEKIYKSVPGIANIHARELSNELGDMSQFSNEKKLFSFLGLTPSEHSSGENTRQGNISRQGRSVLRKIFIEAAWVAITKDKSLQEIFSRLSKKKGSKKAIVAVARRLAGRIRSCLLSGQEYKIVT